MDKSNSFIIHSLKTNTTIHDAMMEEGLFGEVKPQNILWNEFDLEELGIDFDKLRYSTYKTTSEVGLRGWRTRGEEVKDYTGFSLTKNPFFIGDSPTEWHQTLGNKAAKGTYSAKEIDLGEFRNTYHDTYAFNVVHPNFRWVADKFRCAVLRSRCSYAWSKHMNFPYEGGWHVDERSHIMFRLVIPITVGDNWGVDVDGERYILETGKAYVWNNSIRHRVSPTEVGNDPRINLIFGLAPWFEFSSGMFRKNEIWGEDLQEIISQKKFLRCQV